MLNKMRSSLTRVQNLRISANDVDMMDDLVELFASSDCLEYAHLWLCLQDGTAEFPSREAAAFQCSKRLLNVLKDRYHLKKLDLTFGINDLRISDLDQSQIDIAAQAFRLRSTEIRVNYTNYLTNCF